MYSIGSTEIKGLRRLESSHKPESVKSSIGTELVTATCNRWEISLTNSLNNIHDRTTTKLASRARMKWGTRTAVEFICKTLRTNTVAVSRRYIRQLKTRKDGRQFAWDEGSVDQTEKQRISSACGS